MVPFIIFVAGVAVGIGAYKLYDVLKENPQNTGNSQTEFSQQKQYREKPQFTDGRNVNIDSFDISPLNSIMSKYGVDTSSPNCLYLLCNQIKSSTYKHLLDDILGSTKTGEELISFINSVHIETFTFPKATSSKGSHSIPISTIDQLFAESKIGLDVYEPQLKVEMLINSAYASAIDRLKNNFGTEFGKLIKAYEEGRELQPYYNDLIKEIKISSDFMTV